MGERKPGKIIRLSRYYPYLTKCIRSHHLVLFSRHMNVAAVRHQLGTCFFSLRRFTEAAQQYTLALATREVIDATACTGNIEILHEVQALGQVEVELGQYERAEAHFDRQLTMCRQMILEMSSKLSYCLSTDEIACRDEISCRKSVGALIESMTPPMKKRLDAVMRSFLFAMNGLRGISKRKGDAARVSELKTQARIARCVAFYPMMVLCYNLPFSPLTPFLYHQLTVVGSSLFVGTSWTRRMKGNRKRKKYLGHHVKGI